MSDRPATCPVGKNGRQEVLRKRITCDELYIANGLNCSGTPTEVSAVREVVRPQIGAERCRPISEKMQTAYFDTVNERNSKYAHGLTRV